MCSNSANSSSWQIAKESAPQFKGAELKEVADLAALEEYGVEDTVVTWMRATRHTQAKWLGRMVLQPDGRGIRIEPYGIAVASGAAFVIEAVPVADWNMGMPLFETVFNIE